MSVRRRDREGAGVAPRSQRVSAFLAAHPLAVDRTLAAVTLLPVLLLSAFNPPRYWAEMLVPCLAGALALLGRRRAPGRSLLLIAGLIGLTALLAIEPASLLTPAAAIALGTVASRLPSRFAVGGYLALVVGPMLFLTLRGLVQWLVPDATGGSLLEAGGTQRTPLDPLLLVALVLGLLARSRRTRREIRAEQLARRLDQARNRERELLATEMHDVVGHSLTVMIALAGGAASGWRRDPERAELALRHLTEVGASALDDLQRSLAALRGETWEPAARGGDLADRSEEPDSPERLLGAFRAAGLPAELEWRGGSLPADPELAHAVTRIAQEGLTNALRYARGASRVVLGVSVEQDAVRVSVTDDGDGSPVASPGSGLGLAGAAARAEALGGSAEAGPLARGWVLTASIPIRGEA